MFCPTFSKNPAKNNEALANFNFNIPAVYTWYSDLQAYSRTSEQRTLWEQAFCPLFGGYPYLGGSLRLDCIILQ